MKRKKPAQLSLLEFFSEHGETKLFPRQEKVISNLAQARLDRKRTVRIPTPSASFQFEKIGETHINVFTRGESYSHAAYPSKEAAEKGEIFYKNFFKDYEVLCKRFTETEYWNSEEYRVVTLRV